jgi:hypothetical protein
VPAGASDEPNPGPLTQAYERLNGRGVDNADAGQVHFHVPGGIRRGLQALSPVRRGREGHRAGNLQMATALKAHFEFIHSYSPLGATIRRWTFSGGTPQCPGKSSSDSFIPPSAQTPRGYHPSVEPSPTTDACPSGPLRVKRIYWYKGIADQMQAMFLVFLLLINGGLG